MSKHERMLLLLVIALGSVVLLPVTIFVLIALWPQRVLVSWLLLGLVGLVVLACIAVWLVRAATTAKVQLAEEALRPGRLYTNERLVVGRNDEVCLLPDEWREQPYSSGEKLVPCSSKRFTPSMMLQKQKRSYKEDADE